MFLESTHTLYLGRSGVCATALSRIYLGYWVNVKKRLVEGIAHS